MIQKHQDELRQSQSDFHRLQKDKQLPPLMELKLAFLQSIINSTHHRHDLGQKLDIAEKESIEAMGKETQIRLFVEIIQCLAGRNVITHCWGERAYLRREGKFFPWQKCYLTCNTNMLILAPKRNSQDYILKLELQKINLSRSYKKYKQKYIFALYAEDQKQALGFDEEITCKRVHRTLAELLEQKRYWQATKYDTAKFQQEREADRLALPAHKIMQIMDREEYDRLNAFQEKLARVDMLKNEGYKLLKSMEEGRVTVNGKWIRSQAIVKGLTAVQAASCYIQMSQWNPSVSSFQITSRPRTNCLTAQMVTAKYSMLSYQRQAKLMISYFRFCQCHEQKPSNRSYLLIQDLPGQQEEGEKVRMNLKQVLEFIPNQKDPSLLLITVSTEALFNGYCSETDNLNMSIHLFENIDKLVPFSHENGEKFKGFFNEVVCPCGGVKETLDFWVDESLPTERNQNQHFESSPGKNRRQNYGITQKQILQTIEDVCNKRINQEFLQLMTHKIHEKFYLTHKFLPQKDQTFNINKGQVQNFLMQGTRWKLQKEQLVFIDLEALEIQKDILKMVLKQISTNLMKGKSIMSMSLPVQIFIDKSMVDAIADSYGFVPPFLQKVLETKDTVEQLKNIVCAFFFLHAASPNIQKPFNPILGETFQGKIGPYPIYLQQISHHPPISAILIKTKDFQISGNIEVIVDMGLNSLNSYISHLLKVRIYQTNTEYLIKLPQVSLDGIMYGTRTYRVSGKGFVMDTKSNLVCQLSIGKDKKRVYESKTKMHFSDIIGGIFKVKQDYADKIKAKPKLKSFEGLKQDHIVETCCFLSGKWYGDLSFDGVQYKSKSEGPFPYRAQRMKYLLPSDSIWRQDLVHKIWKDNQRSNREKQRLENIQRNDRKLREKYKKTH